MARPFALKPLDSFIKIRVTSEFKDKWKQHCSDNSLDGSKILRKLAEKEISGKG